MFGDWTKESMLHGCHIIIYHLVYCVFIIGLMDCRIEFAGDVVISKCAKPIRD